MRVTRPVAVILSNPVRVALLLCESSLFAVSMGISRKCRALYCLLLPYSWLVSHFHAWLLQLIVFSGALATAVITWRNSLVFHDYDKMVSMFIHIYPPLVFSTIRHFGRGRIPDSRFPAVHKLVHMQPMRALVFSSIFCESGVLLICAWHWSI